MFSWFEERENDAMFLDDLEFGSIIMEDIIHITEKLQNKWAYMSEIECG